MRAGAELALKGQVRGYQADSRQKGFQAEEATPPGTPGVVVVEPVRGAGA